MSLPASRYTLASMILASTLEEKRADEQPTQAARQVALRVGAELGGDLREHLGGRDRRSLTLAQAALEELGYEPVRIATG